MTESWHTHKTGELAYAAVAGGTLLARALDQKLAVSIRTQYIYMYKYLYKRDTLRVGMSHVTHMNESHI